MGQSFAASIATALLVGTAQRHGFVLALCEVAESKKALPTLLLKMIETECSFRCVVVYLRCSLSFWFLQKSLFFVQRFVQHSVVLCHCVWASASVVWQRVHQDGVWECGSAGGAGQSPPGD